MGRTLHFTLTKEKGNFTEKDYRALYDISIKYNSGEFENAWSCENFFIDPYNFYPNWPAITPNGEKMSWNYVNARYEAVQKSNPTFHHFDVVKVLHKEGIIHLHQPNALKGHKIGGFCKTQGNEYNSFLVVRALAECSRTVNCKIELHDEGEYLLCDLIIKKGKCIPDLSEFKSSLQYHIQETFGKEVTKLLSDAAVDLSEVPEMLRDEIFRPGYNLDYAIIQDGKNLVEISNVLKKHWKEDFPLSIWNIKYLDPSKWFPISAFCRPIDPADFAEYGCDISTMMGGFHGEYWNKNGDNDPEADGLRMLGFIQKMLDGTDTKIEILPKLSRG